METSETNNQPLISVLMPAYNAEKYIKEAIESIINQTYQNWELLICDDGSIDNTYAIAKNYIEDKRILVFQNKENLKKPITTNYLFSNSKGSFITIHDADDISLPSRFEEIITFFDNHKDIYMCGHVIQRITEKGKKLPLYRGKNERYEDILNSMKKDNSDGDPSLVIRREVITNIGEIFRPYFQNNMDYDLALRVVEKYKSANITRVLSYYRNVPNSISKEIRSYKKLTTQKMTKFFAIERQQSGRDSLMEENWDLILKKEAEFSKPYIEDKTLYLRETSARFMYYRMEKEAIKYAWKAVVLEPFRLNNFRTFQYCLRKYLLKV